MTNFIKLLAVGALVVLSTGSATAQVGVISGGANSLLSCMGTAAGTPELRPEGYTELLGDVVISCTGGPVMDVGAVVPTTNLILRLSPAVPITSRIIGPNGASEVMLIIDEAGSNIITGSVGGYGPKAPQSYCSTEQQQDQSKPCKASVGTDQSGQYLVSLVGGTPVPAPNVYQGKIGDFGPNSVVFYNVPVLPPAWSGVARTFRIMNLRGALPGQNVTGTLQMVLSASPSAVLPITGTAANVGVVGPALYATVNSAPSGGGSPFVACIGQPVPTLTARLIFTEGFATQFKTRVVPGGAANGMGSGADNPSFPLAAEQSNLVAPFNQNIPGALYGGFAAQSESGFVLPAANLTTSGVTYTAGLMDYGSRLKAVFTNIPAGVTVYVSTANAASYPIPGGTSTVPYAVLVAASGKEEAVNDGPTFTPLTSGLSGSDGLSAYPLTADSLGKASAIWEIMNANPSAQNVLTFSVYVSYASAVVTYEIPDVALSMAPGPGDGTFAAENAAQPLTTPLPRFEVIKRLGGAWTKFDGCSVDRGFKNQTAFFYFPGAGLPPSQASPATIKPSNWPVTVTAELTTPIGGHWLAASLSNGDLTISVDPSGLVVSSTPYTGAVRLSAPGIDDLIKPVYLWVSESSMLNVRISHSGNFVQGQSGATYRIDVSNYYDNTTRTPTTVREQLPSGLTLVSMAGDNWDCSGATCTRTDVLASGASYPPIIVTANVGTTASPQIWNLATVSDGNATPGAFYDSTSIMTVCDISGAVPANVADVQKIINEALGVAPSVHDVNHDGVINVADVQKVINAALGLGCPY